MEHLKISWRVRKTDREVLLVRQIRKGPFYEIITNEQYPWLIGTPAHFLPEDPFGAKTAGYIVELHNYALKNLIQILKGGRPDCASGEKP